MGEAKHGDTILIANESEYILKEWLHAVASANGEVDEIVVGPLTKQPIVL
jgi:hypothetical protein